MITELKSEIEEISNELVSIGYTDVKYLKNKGVCAINKFLFTYGLVYNCDITGYEGRYCYPTYNTAKIALNNWDGVSDPSDSHWIKHKGKTEYSNPNQ